MVCGFVFVCALMCFGSHILKVTCFLLNENIGRTYVELDTLSCKKFGMAHCFLIGKKFGEFCYLEFSTFTGPRDTQNLLMKAEKL